MVIFAIPGAGQALGGNAAGSSAAASAGPVQAATVNFTVDESAPLTNIQIRYAIYDEFKLPDRLTSSCRLHDGTRLTQRFNLTHTVGTIRQFVATGSLSC